VTAASVHEDAPPAIDALAGVELPAGFAGNEIPAGPAGVLSAADNVGSAGNEITDGNPISDDSAYAEIAAGLLEAVERGADGKKWRMPWHQVAAMPANAITARTFRGSNVVSLWAATKRYGLASPLWASEPQWMRVGGMLARRDRGVWLHVPVFDETSGRMWKGAAADASGELRRRPKGLGPIGGDPSGVMVKRLVGFKRGLFFNHADVAGARLPDAGSRHPFAPLEAAERVTRAYQANKGPALLHGGARACYEPGPDRVRMPPRESFAPYDGLDGNAYYYGVLIHEYTHSTGSPRRLRRNLKGSFGSKPYAREELIAEIGSAFVGARIGLPIALRETHAQYVLAWMDALANDRRAFFDAVTKAQAAADYLLRQTGLPEFRKEDDER
jgi:antirestriction protein ArdC